MTKDEKNDLACKLAEHIVEGMDIDTLVTYATECLQRAYQDEYTDEQLIIELKDYAPHLLEEITE